MAVGAELIWAWASEIREKFTGNRVQNIEAADRWLMLSFGGGRDRNLFFSWDAQFCACCTVSAEDWKTLLTMGNTTPPLLSAVKAHLLGAELTGARQLLHDRILELEFCKTLGAGFTQVRRLLFEPSGRHGNLIMVDEDNKIIETAKHIYPEVNRFRATLPGLRYTPPPPFEGPLPREIIMNPNTAPLSQVRGIGAPLLACFRSPEELVPFAGDFPGGFTWLFQKKGHYLTLYPSLLPDSVPVSGSSPLEASREACLSPLLNTRLNHRKKKLTDVLKTRLRQIEKRLAEAQRVLKEHADAPEKQQVMGTLLLANGWQIPKGAAEAVVTEWTENGEIVHRIPLDPLKDISANAKRYFERYRKMKGAQKRAEEILPRLLGEEAEIQEQLVLVECQESAPILVLMEKEITGKTEAPRKGRNKNVPLLPPHRRLDLPLAGAMLYIGLSAKGNHYVTFRLARADDLWFHAQGIPGAHVILRFSSPLAEPVRERCIGLAASLAGWYSKGRDCGRVRVDYAPRRQVRSISGGGPAHVTYRDFKTLLADTCHWQEEFKALQPALEEESF